jgi:hypothetical protein
MRRRVFLGSIVLAPTGVQAHADTTHSKQLRWLVTFTNPSAQTLTDQQFWCYLPSHQHTLDALQVSWPHQLHSDALGHRILQLGFDSVAPWAQKIISIRANLQPNQNQQDHTMIQKERWLQAQRYIEVEHPLVQEAAAKLRRDGPKNTALAIYHFVTQHLRYAGYLADDLGALYALENRRGDCTEYADLVVALARANHIPARMLGGFVAEGDLLIEPQKYHNWAELYLQDRWCVVDAQKQCWLEPSAPYVAFRIAQDAPTNPIGSAHRYRLQGQLQVQ